MRAAGRQGPEPKRGRRRRKSPKQRDVPRPLSRPSATAQAEGQAQAEAVRRPSGAEPFRREPITSEADRSSYGSRDGPRGAERSSRGRNAEEPGRGRSRSRGWGGQAAGGGGQWAGAAGRPGPRGGGGGGRMIKLFSLKQQKKEEESAGGTKGSSKKASAAQLRIQKDINELNLPKTCEIDFSDQDDLLNFKLVICPDEGFYKAGKFVFSFKVGQGYPHDPPKVKCETMVYHPNIDLEGNVCLNILSTSSWSPTPRTP
ncbi:NEDD8-conjugating enzyme Ubc12 isoform X2 [Dromiciops gliroides]|uniref:NEDD8-conjugating enzyme Ubc12 isoform X2 n=1 Tax=Dromiciops gliroides TaxID=33562 RepID=UPI001CC69252|nr:NEDD8-conjugating enzyme Ubc12 isoform X2 [Dromiciops gliroides]